MPTGLAWCRRSFRANELEPLTVTMGWRSQSIAAPVRSGHLADALSCGHLLAVVLGAR